MSRAVLDAPTPVTTTVHDLLLAAHGQVLAATRDQPLDLPALADAGPAALDRAARAALAGRPDAVVAGIVPFDPVEPPALAVHTGVRRLPAPAEPAPQAGVEEPADLGRSEHYEHAVTHALARLGRGELTKVVLARTVEIPATGLDVDDLWARLAAGNPAGWTFAVRHEGGTFLGASPELVASVDHGVLRTHPLAGSLPRPTDPVQEDAAACRLLASAKDLHEHRLVVDHIAAALAPHTHHLDVPATPQVTRTDSMLHLGTPMTGRARPGVGSLQAALAIHPTPAVCGVPTGTALATIRELEAEPRGPYAGLVGWCDADGNGEWALALRCAHVRPDAARLYAGAGIVVGSTPAAEHAETTAKLRTVARALAQATHDPLSQEIA